MQSRPENMPIAISFKKSISQIRRKIAHNESNPASCFSTGLHQAYSPETASTGSSDEYTMDENELERLRRRTPVVLKKSGELVKSALRQSSARQKPSSMASTPAIPKVVIARFTLDDWKTASDVAAEFITDLHPLEGANGYDRFNFSINLADQTNLESKTLFFCVKYCVNGQEYWDNNSSVNFQVYFKKRSKQHNGKNDMRVVSSRPLKPLLRGGKKSPLANFERPKPTSVTFGDFYDGSYSKHRLNDFKQHANDCFGNSCCQQRSG
jgi:hypothetical protein